MRKVFIEFAKHAFEGEINIIDPTEDIDGVRHKYRVMDTIPFYDQVYKIINTEIDNYGLEKPALISWLSQDGKRKSRGYLVPNISSINDPFGLVERIYKQVDYDFYRGQSYPGKMESSGSRKKQRKTG